MLDKKIVDKWVDKFPKLEIALLAGVVGMKMIRELIGVDKWYMQDIYKELVLAGAVEGASSSYFRATKECKLYLQERLMKRELGISEEEEKC